MSTLTAKYFPYMDTSPEINNNNVNNIQKDYWDS